MPLPCRGAAHGLFASGPARCFCIHCLTSGRPHDRRRHRTASSEAGGGASDLASVPLAALLGMLEHDQAAGWSVEQAAVRRLRGVSPGVRKVPQMTGPTALLADRRSDGALQHGPTRTTRGNREEVVDDGGRVLDHWRSRAASYADTASMRPCVRAGAAGAFHAHRRSCSAMRRNEGGLPWSETRGGAPRRAPLEVVCSSSPPPGEGLPAVWVLRYSAAWPPSYPRCSPRIGGGRARRSSRRSWIDE